MRLLIFVNVTNVCFIYSIVISSLASALYHVGELVSADACGR